MEDGSEMTFDWPLEKMARYPFFKDSKEYIKRMGPDLKELVEDRVWDMVRTRGKERILQAIDKGEIKEVPMSNELDKQMELFSYPIARILVSSIDDNYLINRYCLGESEKFLKNLKNESVEEVLKIGNELGIDAERSEGLVKVHFIDFLENTEHLKSTEWKLVNQNLRDGFVYLDVDKFMRLQKESLFQQLVGELPKPVTEGLKDIFSSHIEDIDEFLNDKKKDFEEVDLGVVDSDKFPPCIKKMISLQEEGVNLSHEGRFALTAFLHQVGLSEEEILSFFSGSPDFREDLALYQIEHITGKISGTEYTTPGCNTMRTNGICYNPDSLCDAEWMKHPLSYYSYKKKSESKENGESKENEKNSKDEN